MTWHKTRKLSSKNDAIRRHIADNCKWNALDFIEPEFVAEPRNPRLGVSTDGLNLFVNQSSTHSSYCSGGYRPSSDILAYHVPVRKDEWNTKGIHS